MEHGCLVDLHVGTCHGAKLLLKDGKHVPHCGGERLGIQHSDGAATLGNEDTMKAGKPQLERRANGAPTRLTC